MNSDNDDFLLDLHAIIETSLGSDSDAKQCAATIIAKVSKKWAGGYVYVTKCAQWQLNERDQAVYRRYNGNNRREVCRDFSISESLFFSIIKRVHNQKQSDWIRE